MSILQFPQNIVCSNACPLCGRQIELEFATIGPVSADGAVVLLCGGHLWDGLQFIDQLADYMATERDKYFRNNLDDILHFGGGRQGAGLIY